MENNEAFLCQFCKRDVRGIGKEHYQDDTPPHKVTCWECYHADKPLEPSTASPTIPQEELEKLMTEATHEHGHGEHNHGEQHKQEIQIDMSTWVAALPEFTKERIRQTIYENYNPSNDQAKSISDYILVVERILETMKDLIVSGQPHSILQARYGMVKIGVETIKYAESHPIPSF